MNEFKTFGITAAVLVVLFAALALMMANKRRQQKTTKHIEFSFTVCAKRKKTVMMQNQQITTDQALSVAALFETQAGNVVPIVGVPVWTIDNPAVATLQLGPGGMSVLVVSVAPGTATVTVTGEGDPTPGKDTVSNSFGVTVVSPEASQVVFQFGGPADKAAAIAALSGTSGTPAAAAAPLTSGDGTSSAATASAS